MTSAHNQKIMAIWLFICCATIFSMVVLGGVTRLTGSGLSMVEWAPIMGTLPPLSHIEWLETFELYKSSPEFLHINYNMDLDGFKSIFWFEYSHRVLGRFIGMLFSSLWCSSLSKAGSAHLLSPGLSPCLFLAACRD